MSIGLKIKELSEQKKVDAVWLAKRLGKTKQAVYDIFSKEDVNTSILRVLSKALEVPVSSFFDEEPSSMNTKVTQKGDNSVMIGNNNGVITKLENCAKEVVHLKELLAEKERLINVLMERK